MTQHKSFRDFQIKPTREIMAGDKISIDDILNEEISVLKFEITDSKFKKKADDQCLKMQIQIAGKTRVYFSGSKNLIDLIKQVPEEGFPFTTTIKKNNRILEFT